MGKGEMKAERMELFEKLLDVLKKNNNTYRLQIY